MSGGCVEGAVYELGEQVLADGRPVLQRYGVTDDDAFAVGLTCGGILDVFVEKVNRETFPQLGEVAESVGTEEPVAVATVVAGPADRLGTRLVVWPDRVDGQHRLAAAGRRRRATTPAACSTPAAPRCCTTATTAQRRGDDLEVFVESFAPPPRMIVFGAIDFAAAVRADRRVPRLPGHRLRRPAGVRDGRRGSRTPTRSSSSGRTGTCGRGRGRADRRAHRALRAHPRPEVRRPAAGGRAAAAGRLRRGDGLAAHARGPAGAAASSAG